MEIIILQYDKYCNWNKIDAIVYEGWMLTLASERGPGEFYLRDIAERLPDKKA